MGKKELNYSHRGHTRKEEKVVHIKEAIKIKTKRTMEIFVV